VAKAGVDTFVAGSAVFGAGRDSDPHRYDTVIAALRAELKKSDGFPARRRATSSRPMSPWIMRSSASVVSMSRRRDSSSLIACSMRPTR